MRRSGRALVASAFIFGVTATAAAQPFSSIIVFGDSLSDGGQFAGVSSSPRPAATRRRLPATS